MDAQLTLFPRITEENQNDAENQISELQKVVDYEIREYPIEVIVQKLKEGEIFVPKYQRKYVWDEKKASKFIESLILGLPIPYIFLADNEGRSEIVDGSQRIRTLEYFLDNKLVLCQLEKLTKIESFRFTDFAPSRQKRFKKKTLRLIELTDKADFETRRDVFQRINTTPVKLTEMEIRRGSFEGNFSNLVSICATNKKFRILCPIGADREARGERDELVLRFFAYSEKYMEFVHSVKDFLDEFIVQKNATDINQADLEEEFENMLDFVDKYFPNGFRKSMNHTSTPRVRFEAIAVGVNLALKIKPNLIPTQPVSTWLNSKEFEEHTTSDAANNKNKLLGRIEYVRDQLLS